MQIGVIGIGRMGGGITRRLCARGHEVIAFDRDIDQRGMVEPHGAVWADSLETLVGLLKEARRVVWLMLPAGKTTRSVMLEVAHLLKANDIVVDGGNSNYKDSIEADLHLAEMELAFVDAGTSGGVRGESAGYSLMVGGNKADVVYLEPVFASLIAKEGELEAFVHAGPAGSGHYTKMIQNGIEYGMMQSLAEGFDLLKRANKAHPDFNLDLAAIAGAWRKGSVVQSWLLDLLHEALLKDGSLSAYTGSVPDSGTGRWTVETALDTATPAQVLTTALMQRFATRQDDPFAAQVLSALRSGFGGHTEEQSYRP